MDPRPGVDHSSTVPPWSAATCLTMDRPSPVPPVAHEQTRLGREVGDAERDAFWLHFDVMPTAAELASPEDFLTMRRAAADMDTQIDADLASLLDGTLGWADGAREADENDSQGLGDQAQD